MGGNADEPENDPIKVGYEFMYWTKENTSEGSINAESVPEEFLFETIKIKKNTQLYAYWEPRKTVPVTFDGNRHIMDLFTEFISYNDFAIPLNPELTLSGYRFDAWVEYMQYEDSVAEYVFYPQLVIGEPFGFDNTRITHPIFLVARWIKTYTVTFYTDEGSAIGPWTVDEGVSYEAPDPPTKSGYTFDYWKDVTGDEYEDGQYRTRIAEDENQYSFEFPAKFYGNTDLLAIYTENPEPPPAPRKSYSPNAVNDSLTTDMNTPVSVSASKLMSNDSHVNNFESVQGASNGTVKLSGNTVKFTPDTDFAGEAKFKYTIGYKGKTDTATVNAVIIEDETPLGASNRYIIGYEKGNARIFDPTTRAELATMYARLLSLNYQATTIPRYMDVYSTMWHASYVNILKETGILVGKDNKFDPEGLITRADLASSIARYYEFVGETFEPTASGLTDIEGHVAQSDIEIVVAQEMMGAHYSYQID